MLESSLPCETDRDTLTNIDGLLDLWYGIQGAVKNFAEWTKSRMDALPNFSADDRFVTAAAGLDLPQEEKVKHFTLKAFECHGKFDILSNSS